MRFPILVIIFFSLANILSAQSPLEQKTDLVLFNNTLEEGLNELMDNANIKIAFANDILSNYLSISLQARNKTVAYILDKLLKDTNLTYKLVGQQIVLYAYLPPTAIQFTLSGYLTDSESGERLIAAAVFDSASGKGTVTNEYGFYSLTIPNGNRALSFSYLGYQPTVRRIDVKQDQVLSIDLQPSLTLQEVVVVAADTLITSGSDAGSNQRNVSPNQVENLPALGGESDLHRSLQLLPGVQTGPDGVGGLHIRGGSIDQNFTLIDGVPVYNPSHALGVFSIFNTSAIRTSTLFKGGFPARYGGRLSSVLDVRTKEGNLKEIRGEASIGLVAARFSLEGPIKKDRTSFFLSARHSLVNLYLNPLSRRALAEDGSNGETNYRLYDINAKLNHKFSSRDQVYLSFYQGRDDFASDRQRERTVFFVDDDGNPLAEGVSDFRIRNQVNYGNTIGALRWNRMWSNKLFGNTTLTFSRYYFNDGYQVSDSLILANQVIGREFTFVENQSSIQDIAAKVDFDYIPNSNHYLRFGTDITQHEFVPGVLAFNENSEFFTDTIAFGTMLANDSIRSLEYNFYIEDEIKVSDKWLINAGLRYSGLLVRNKNYNYLQPRLSIFWQAAPRLSFRASGGRMIQYLHLLNSSNIGLTTDLWVSSTERVEPETAWQFDCSATQKISPKFQLTVEAYYKKMNHLLTYVEGANTVIDWEDNVTVGEGTAYGAEVLLEKTLGKTTGWLGYTFSNTNRQFPNVNFGRVFPYRFDRRHVIQFAVTHQFSNKFEISANYLFGTGLAFTLPVDKYLLFVPGDTSAPEVIVNRSRRNNFRMPDYHRLDAGIHLRWSKKTDKRIIKHHLHVGIYNAFSQRQPLYFAIRSNPNAENLFNREIVTVEVLPAIPALSYEIKF
ncbi:MAG: TonB-dependent receptor [Saprospiraceae bacterium]